MTLQDIREYSICKFSLGSFLLADFNCTSSCWILPFLWLGNSCAAVFYNYKNLKKYWSLSTPLRRVTFLSLKLIISTAEMPEVSIWRCNLRFQALYDVSRKKSPGFFFFFLIWVFPMCVCPFFSRHTSVHCPCPTSKREVLTSRIRTLSEHTDWPQDVLICLHQQLSLSRPSNSQESQTQKAYTHLNTESSIFYSSRSIPARNQQSVIDDSI